MYVKLLLYVTFSYLCMRPYVTSVYGLKILLSRIPYYEDFPTLNFRERLTTSHYLCFCVRGKQSANTDSFFRELGTHQLNKLVGRVIFFYFFY